MFNPLSFFHPIAFKIARFEFKNAWQHFLLFLICLTLAVTVITSINLFANFVKKGLDSQVKSLMGGDIELVAENIKPDSVIEFLKQFGQISYVATLRTMLRNENSNQLEQIFVSLKAIDDNYPLFGQLVFASNKIKTEVLSSANTVAISQDILSRSQLKIGDWVRIGQQKYQISDTIKIEPDRVIQGFNFRPRVMMNHEGLKQSGLIQNMTLVNHRYRIKLNDIYIQNPNFADEIKQLVQQKYPKINWEINIQDEGNQRINNVMSRLRGFLTLMALGIFLIAGIGIASSIRSYLAKNYQSITILKILGANQKIILQSYTLIIAMITLIASLIGILIAYLIFYSFIPIIEKIIPNLSEQSSFDYLTPIFSIWFAFLITYLFSIPSLVSLLKVKASSLFRQKIYVYQILIGKLELYLMIALGALLALSLILNADKPWFVATCLAVMAISLGIYIALAYGIEKISHHIKTNQLWLSLAIKNIQRNKANLYTIVLAIGINLSFLFVLSLTEANFQKQIEIRDQSQIPDLFMIDIQPNQIDLLTEFISKNNSQINALPMVRGRITHINKIDIDQLEVPESIDWALNEDRGFSFASKMPKNANLVAGNWWDENYQGEALASVDERLLKEMDLKIGDQITVNILGETIEAKIASARRIDYASFQLNFFLMLSPNAIGNFPHNYVATAILDQNELKNQAQIVRTIAQNFANITIIETKQVIDLIQDIVEKASFWLKMLTTISIAAGILVFFSVLSTSMQEKFYDTAIFKALGFNWSSLIKMHLFEWLAISVISCFIAIFIGSFAAYLIDYYFANDYRSVGFYLSVVTILQITVITLAVISLITYLGIKKIFNIKVANLLRND